MLLPLAPQSTLSHGGQNYYPVRQTWFQHPPTKNHPMAYHWSLCILKSLKQPSKLCPPLLSLTSSAHGGKQVRVVMKASFFLSLFCPLRLCEKCRCNLWGVLKGSEGAFICYPTPSQCQGRWSYSVNEKSISEHFPYIIHIQMKKKYYIASIP